AARTPVTRASTPPAPSGPAKPAEPARVRVVISKLRMTEGFIRFVDRTTNPPYAEEISGITLVGDNLGTTPTRQGAAPRRGTLDLRGTLASGTPLAVKGQVGSYPGPLFLDITVNVEDFPVPRLNPYLDRLSSWIARQGTLTAALSYKVNGDELDAVNQVEIDGLQLEPGGHGQARQGRRRADRAPGDVPQGDARAQPATAPGDDGGRRHAATTRGARVQAGHAGRRRGGAPSGGRGPLYRALPAPRAAHLRRGALRRADARDADAAARAPHAGHRPRGRRARRAHPRGHPGRAPGAHGVAHRGRE